MKRALSLILAVALVLALAPVTALATSEAYGNEVWLQDTALHDGVTLSDNIYWSTYYSQLRHGSSGNRLVFSVPLVPGS